MKTAFSYHRYSSDLQRDGYTLEAQRRITKEIAKKYNSRIIQVYEDEAISGATIDKRPSMLQLLEDLPKLKPDFLISTDQDRIARGNDFWVIKNKLVKSKTSIITEKEGLIDQNDITKDAMSDMMAVFAKLERKLIGRRVARGLKEKSTKGLWHSGSKPLGYDLKNGQIIRNPEKAVLIRRIFDLFIKGHSAISISKTLNSEGHRTSTGIKFRHVSITNILKNVSYIGKIKNNGDIYNGIHEPLINTYLFEKAQKILDIKHIKSKTKPMKYLLTGFLFCSRCSNKMYGKKYYYAKIYRNSNSKYIHGYYCYSKHRDFSCLAIIGSIDDYVLDLIDKKIKKLNLDFKKGAEKINKIESNLDHLNKDINEIELKISRLITGYIDGIIPIDEYKKRNENLKNTKILLQKELDNYESKNLNSDVLDLINNNNFDIDKLDYYGKRELIDMFIHKIIIYPSKSRNYKDRLDIIWKV